ncbi:vitelline membrane protein 15a-1-like [Topomyia yanbarensis]|uniref:vitelline membrane protein 15a-1-like n=1 Tax=Topomyia yanbarensis TaxID=2498891 RepID=UPI00273B3E88|nr:vitelline membrane protein 15a-1-like [Topomyia yanbarensis]
MSKFIVLAVLAVVAGTMASYAPAPAPSYHAPAPAASYHAPAPAYHAAPVKCGANLLVGCAPNVAHVPCVPSHGGGGHGGYGHGSSHVGSAHRSADAEAFESME